MNIETATGSITNKTIVKTAKGGSVLKRTIKKETYVEVKSLVTWLRKCASENLEDHASMAFRLAAESLEQISDASITPPPILSDYELGYIDGKGDASRDA